MLASRLPSLIPQMTLEESLQVASLASVSRQLFEYKKMETAAISQAPSHRKCGSYGWRQQSAETGRDLSCP